MAITILAQTCIAVSADSRKVTYPSGLAANTLLNSIGINIHDSYTDTSYAPRGDPSATLRTLKDLGVKWVRLGLKREPQPYVAALLNQLHRSGVHVLGVIGAPDDTDGGFYLGQQDQLVAALQRPPYKNRVDMLELPNEQDLFGASDKRWPTELESFNASYYAAVKANKKIAKIPILGPSMAFSSNYSRLEVSTNRNLDLVNIHPYAGDSTPESGFLGVTRERALTAGGVRSHAKVIASEFGFPTLRGHYSDNVAAALTLRTFLWNRTHGVIRSFSYELFDEKPDPEQTDIQQHYGLVQVSGNLQDIESWRQTKKPSYRALRRLIRLLQQHEGAGFEEVRVQDPRPIANLAVTRVHHRDGTIDIFVWSLSGKKERVSLGVSKPGSSVTVERLVGAGNVHRLSIEKGRVSTVVDGIPTLIRFSP